MKRTLKKYLPRPVIQKIIIARDILKLALVPKNIFAEECLRNDLTAEKIDAFFKDDSYKSGWQSAFEGINSIFRETVPGGGVNPGDRRALYYLIRALQPEKLLEIGTHVGASTVFLAAALRDTSKTSRMTTVDILDVNAADSPWYQQKLSYSPKDFLEKLGTSDYVTFRVSPSSTYLENTDETFDFIFLDGDHSAKTVYQEVSLALNKLNSGGVILLHDYYPEAKSLFRDGNIISGPFVALKRIMKENPNIRVIPLGDLPWPTKNNLNVTSLALVTRLI